MADTRKGGLARFASFSTREKLDDELPHVFSELFEEISYVNDQAHLVQKAVAEILFGECEMDETEIVEETS